MIRTAIIIITIVAFTMCTNPQVTENSYSKESRASEDAPVKTAKIEFEHLSYDFGIITIGEKVTHIFNFKNTGDLPLVITNAQASCGCTVPEFPREPVNPGKKGIIKVVFNSFNKSGLQDAVVTITTNGEPEKSLLHLTGDIRPATGR